MSERLKKILKGVYSKEIVDMFGINITLEELLTKDESGITVLEHLLKNEVEIYEYRVNNLDKSVEAAYLFFKYNKGLYMFGLSEEDLFKEINGEKFIYLLAKDGKVTSKMIKAVKNHLEIIDVLILEGYSADWHCVSKEVIDSLMQKGQNGQYYVEKYFDNNDTVRNFINLIDDSRKLIYLCRKYNKLNLLKFANENVLMYEMDSNFTLLEYLLKENIIPNALTRGSENFEFINLLRRKNLYQYLINEDEDILIMKFDGNKTLLEEIMDNGYSLNPIKRIRNVETIQILYRAGKLYLLTNVNDKTLLKPAKEIFGEENLNDQTLLEYLLDNGYNPIAKASYIYEPEVVRIICNKGYYSYLSKLLDEEMLLLELEPGVLVVDKLLENNVDIIKPYATFKTENMVKRLFEKGKLDILFQCKLEVLLNFANESNSYLDYLLDAIKSKKIRYSLNKMLTFDCSKEDAAKFYLLIAKKGMIEYIRELEVDKLLKEEKGKTLLDALLDLDSKLTVDVVLSKKVKSNVKIASILKSRGLEQKDVDISSNKQEFTSKYLKNYENIFGIGPLLEEDELLLEQLKNLFISDGASDLELVLALVSGYRQSLFQNHDISVQELKTLINIKETNLKNFLYVKNYERTAYFSQCDGSVHCNRPVVGVLLHETGHALHYYEADLETPENYKIIVGKLRQDKELLKKVEKFSKIYDKTKERIKSIVSEKCELFFESYYTPSKMLEIENDVLNSKKENMDKLSSLGLSEKALEEVLASSFTIEEYINHQKRIFIEQYTSDMLENEFGQYIAIFDILDAIYEGELNSGELKNVHGDKINRMAGHGIAYYYDSCHGFDEMIANFSALVKGKNSSESLELLKYFVGEELYDMISKFYFCDIMQLDENKLQGKAI